MIAALIATASLAVASGCPSVSSITTTAQAAKDTENWLHQWASGAWKGVPASDQRFRILVHDPLGHPGYEMRGWRTEKGWRVFSREVNDPNYRRPLRHPNWAERRVDPDASRKIDAIWNDGCLWSTPRIRLDPAAGGKYVRPRTPTIADRINAAVVSYDLERGDQVWLGQQAIAAGLPPKLADITLALAISSD